MKVLTSIALAVSSLASLAEAQYPQPYCTAGVSSNFCVAQIAADRQPNLLNNVFNSAGCLITVSGVPGNRQGLVFYGIDNAGFTPSVWAGGLSGSYLCVKAPVQRMGAPQNSGGAAGGCDGAYSVDWDVFQNSNATSLGNPWAPGDKVFVQSWYRDPAAPAVSNLSNAVELTLTAAPAPCVTPIPGMVVIPAGAFTMGSNAACAVPYLSCGGTELVHQVTISYCFWMGATEVTQSQYASLAGTNPAFFLGANNPVERVSWFDAQVYCVALTSQQAALGNVPLGYHYRLPTEAEWEYACRAGTTTEFNLGADLFCNQARFDHSWHSGSSCSSFSSATVGSYAPNAWGLHDMHGNVYEWCLDSYTAYPAGAVTDPFVTGSFERVLRGGSWNHLSNQCRSAHRLSYDPTETEANNIGFRVVLAPILVP